MIAAGDGWGPHGQKIGQFNDDAAADDFCVDYVKVYQNENDLPAVQSGSDFTGSFDLDEKRYAKAPCGSRTLFIANRDVIMI